MPSREEEKKPYGARRTVTGMPIVPREVGIPYMQTLVRVISSRGERPGSLINRTFGDNRGYYEAINEAIILLSHSRPTLNIDDAKDVAYFAYALVEMTSTDVVAEEYTGVMELLAELRKTRVSSEREKRGLRARLKESFRSLLGRETKKAKELAIELRKAYKTMGVLLTRTEEAERRRNATRTEYLGGQKKIERLQAEVDKLKLRLNDKPRKIRELTDEERARRDALRSLDQEEEGKNGRYLIHHGKALLNGDSIEEEEEPLAEKYVRGRRL